MKRFLQITLSIFIVVSLFSFGGLKDVRASTPVDTDFETDDWEGWTPVNGSEDNHWVVDSEAGSSTTGSYAAYISDEGTCDAPGDPCRYEYNTGDSAIVHFYRDIIFPAGESLITLTFYWKSDGEDGNDDDRLTVRVVNTSTTPTVGNEVGGDLYGTYSNGDDTTWNSESILLSGSYAGTTQRLVFTWVNDRSSGSQPPAAIDDILITTEALEYYIGDKVWLDRDENGLQDPGEGGVAGVTVQLRTSSGTLVGTTISNADGEYWFNNPPSGDYYLVFIEPDYYGFTLQNQGADDTLDSDADITTGRTATFTWTAGGLQTQWDAGLVSDNPSLTASCGLDIVLVLDVSGSINDTEFGQMRSAAVDFIDTFLPATPTQIAVVQFSNYASVVQGFTNDLTLLYGDKGGVGGWGALTRQTYTPPTIQYTNWDDALYDARNLFPGRAEYPDLIIFATDGNPTAYGGNGGVDVVTNATETNAMNYAVPEAEAAKAAGIRILSIGIGGDLNTDNLVSISGPILHPPAPITIDTDVISADFDELAFELENLATQLCGGTCTVYKVIDTDNDLSTTADQVKSGGAVAEWTFTVTAMDTGITLSPGQNDYEETTTSGAVNFEFDIAQGVTFPVDITIQETLKSTKWTFINAECFLNGTTPLAEVVVNSATATVSNIEFNAYNDIVSCYFYNYPKPTSVELIFFTARVEGQSIVLDWETATEVDNLGFNLYRATSLDGERTKLNTDLIPSLVPPGSTYGALYEFVDADVVLGGQYFYWLEDVDLAGRVKSIHGPVEERVLPFKMFLPMMVN